MSALWGLSMGGTVTAIVQNLSGFPLLRRIILEQSSSSFTRLPIWTMTITTLQIGLYGVFTLGWPDCLQLALCNFLGALFWLVNVVVFIAYAGSPRERLELAAYYLASLVWGVGLPLGLYLSPSTASLAPSTKQTILGVFMQAANFSGFLSPVSSLVVAWREKDVTRVPGMLSYVNLVNSTLWVAYGVLLGDGWIWIPNVVGLFLSGLQVAALAALSLLPQPKEPPPPSLVLLELAEDASSPPPTQKPS